MIERNSRLALGAGLLLFAAGCETDPGIELLSIAGTWCAEGESATAPVEIFMTPPQWADAPLVLDFDLEYRIEFCDRARTCISDPFMIDLTAVQRLPGESWCKRDVCFSIESPVNGIRRVSTRHQTYGTTAFFELDEIDRVSRMTLLDQVHEPCEASE